jgi:hypothetical protein
MSQSGKSNVTIMPGAVQGARAAVVGDAGAAPIRERADRFINREL